MMTISPGLIISSDTDDPAGLFYGIAARHQAQNGIVLRRGEEVDLLLPLARQPLTGAACGTATAVVSVVPDAESIGTADDAAIMREYNQISFQTEAVFISRQISFFSGFE